MMQQPHLFSWSSTSKGVRLLSESGKNCGDFEDAEKRKSLLIGMVIVTVTSSLVFSAKNSISSVELRVLLVI